MNIFKDRLLHFLVLGAALFAVYGFVDREPDAQALSKKIVIDRDTLLTHVQYRSKAFNDTVSQKILDDLSKRDLDGMIRELVREEVLFREAKAMNLDRDDYVIRLRLVQKMEFITKGLLSASAVSEEAVGTYFEEHRTDYYVEPYVTFTHVFYNREKHGRDEASRLANEKLKELNGDVVPFSASVSHGDRFPYHVNYVERVPDYVGSHFGNEMARMLFTLNPDRKYWYGPYESQYGFHLVMISQRAEGRFPEVEEIYDRVKEDARQAYIRDQTEAVIDEIVKGYDIEVVYDREAGAGGQES